MADASIATIEDSEHSAPFVAPWPGSHGMPRWNAGNLVDAPTFTWKNWFAMLGPGLLVGGSAIGGGEWLAGPAVTARYGGALMWLATLSILGQVFYNLEISRYALYTGEPIFTGKFRTLPGPRFWLFMYLILDFGAVFPYLAANAATPLAAMYLGRIPSGAADEGLVRGLGFFVFFLAMVPLVFGGKIYNTLKIVMSFKIVTVLSFLLLVAIFFSSRATWIEITSGFFKFGTVPVQRNEDANGNGKLDPGEDWDHDGHLDVAEPALAPSIDTDGDGTNDAWSDVNGDGKPDKFADLDHDGFRDGDGTENLFTALFSGRPMPKIDFSTIALLAAFAAIAGCGGLSNAPISNYTRDQGWGMGHHVGAIPSVVGGHNIELSHVGMVFEVTRESLVRWRHWVKHVLRDQLVVWMPACFLGMALPSMLSVQFLRRGTEVSDWYAAGMTADGVSGAVTQAWGQSAGAAIWYLTLLCGFLVLAPAMASSSDGVVRRWVDVVWTSSRHLRSWDPKHIRTLYFAVLLGFMAIGLSLLSIGKPLVLLKIGTNIMNFALGFSCLHTLVINLILLPKELRPNWFVRLGLAAAGVFFLSLATITTIETLRPYL
ncbi:MAG TPA: Nramp family divalent metal transporter [Pirellulales bacterium]|nr:Nramp family divalent metal transporter [Pirellulales bacterium]